MQIHVNIIPMTADDCGKILHIRWYFVYIRFEVRVNEEYYISDSVP